MRAGDFNLQMTPNEVTFWESFPSLSYFLFEMCMISFLCKHIRAHVGNYACTKCTLCIPTSKFFRGLSYLIVPILLTIFVEHKSFRNMQIKNHADIRA